MPMTWNLTDFRRQMANVKKAIITEMAAGAGEVLDAFHRDQVQTRLSEHGPKSLGARSGDLRRALRRSPIRVQRNAVSGRVYVRGPLQQKKAATHIYGATITPTNAKYLTVPTRFALAGDRPRGRPRRRSARQWPNTFVKRTKGGKLMIFQRRGKGKRREIVPLYVLKKSVKVPKRWPFFEDWEAFMRPGGLFGGGGIGHRILKKRYSRAVRRGRAVA